MSISFDSVPSNLRVPFVGVEISSENAEQGPALMQYRGLLLGQKTSGGTGTANAIVRVTSADQVGTLAGRGSLAHRTAMGWFRATKAIETWLGLVDDHASGVPATSTCVCSGTSTAAGTVHLRIGGVPVDVAVASGTAAASVASAIVTAVNADTSLPVTAALDTASVVLTAKNDGTHGNEIDVRLNYLLGEALPAGISLTTPAFTSGAQNPVLTTLIAAMGDRPFQIVVHPWTDATSLAALEAEMHDRFGGARMLDGVMVYASASAYGTVAALGESRNSPHACLVPTHGHPTLPWEIAGALGGKLALSAQNDPARPLAGEVLPGCLPPAESARFTLSERNLLLYSGVSALRATAGGEVAIDQLITTYRTNSVGATSTAYLYVYTMLTLAYLRYSYAARIGTRFARHKLASDGTRFGAGQAVATPKIIKAESMAWFRQMEELGLVENADQFKRDLVVERDATDVNRVNVLLPPDLINQLIVTAVKIGFIL